MNVRTIVEEIMASQEWTPFEEADEHRIHPDMANLLTKLSYDPVPFKIYKNNLYQVAKYAEQKMEGWPKIIHLSIKRIDKHAIHDWRHLQRIKNELVGPEHEAVELYPAESRLVDTCNQYHLFVLADSGTHFPFGFQERMICNDSTMGTKQRPFPPGAEPSDCQTLKEYAAKKGFQV